MEIKNKKSFHNLIKSLTEEIIEEEDLDETTATGNVAGYMTPFAFSGKDKKSKKKNKEISTNSTDFEQVNEVLDKKDLQIIIKLIRDVVGDIYRDIWIKRNSWK